MFIDRFTKPVTPLKPEDEELSERGYFWIGWLCGLGSAVTLYFIVTIVGGLLV